MLEIPVQFLPISPERVKRTSVPDGLRAIGVALRERIRGQARSAVPPADALDQQHQQQPSAWTES
jgi:hypothetical protein